MCYDNFDNTTSKTYATLNVLGGVFEVNDEFRMGNHKGGGSKATVNVMNGGQFLHRNVKGYNFRMGQGGVENELNVSGAGTLFEVKGNVETGHSGSTSTVNLSTGATIRCGRHDPAHGERTDDRRLHADPPRRESVRAGRDAARRRFAQRERPDRQRSRAERRGRRRLPRARLPGACRVLPGLRRLLHVQGADRRRVRRGARHRRHRLHDAARPPAGRRDAPRGRIHRHQPCRGHHLRRERERRHALPRPRLRRGQLPQHPTPTRAARTSIPWPARTS